MKADKEYVSEYAKERPDTEDIAESLVSWVALRCHTNRQDVESMDLIKIRITDDVSFISKHL